MGACEELFLSPTHPEAEHQRFFVLFSTVFVVIRSDRFASDSSKNAHLNTGRGCRGRKRQRHRRKADALASKLGNTSESAILGTMERFRWRFDGRRLGFFKALVFRIKFLKVFAIFKAWNNAADESCYSFWIISKLEWWVFFYSFLLKKSSRKYQNFVFFTEKLCSLF